MKTTEAIMEILAAYDLTGSYRDAAASGGVLAPHGGPLCTGARRGRAENDAGSAQSTDRSVSREDRRVG